MCVCVCVCGVWCVGCGVWGVGGGGGCRMFQILKSI